MTAIVECGEKHFTILESQNIFYQNKVIVF